MSNLLLLDQSDLNSLLDNVLFSSVLVRLHGGEEKSYNSHNCNS